MEINLQSSLKITPPPVWMVSVKHVCFEKNFIMIEKSWSFDCVHMSPAYGTQVLCASSRCEVNSAELQAKTQILWSVLL